MYVIVDNFDSFTYNLKAYFEEMGREITVIRSDAVSVEAIEGLKPQGIVISPGPKRPADAGASIEAVRYFKGKLPILGVCLGHQVIGYTEGATVQKGDCPMHGKVTEIETSGQGLFAGLPRRFSVTRYHSLVVERKTLPECYRVDAWTKEGTVMAFSHRELPVYGVQFHPEAVLTQYGHELLENFCRICEQMEAAGDLEAELIKENSDQRAEYGSTKRPQDGGLLRAAKGERAAVKEDAGVPGEKAAFLETNEHRRIEQLSDAPAIAELFSVFAEDPDVVFLDSSLVNELGRYSVIGLAPYQKVVKTKEGCTVNGQPAEESFEEYVKQYLKENQDHNDTGLPIVSGAIGYFTYDYGRERMGIGTRHPLEVELPDAVLTFYDAFLVEDAQEKKTYLAANGKTEDAEVLLMRLKQRIRKALSKWPECEARVQSAEKRTKPEDLVQGNTAVQCGQTETGRQEARDVQTGEALCACSVFPNFEKQEYMETVDAMIRYIFEGDIYIANMTQHLTVKSDREPYEVFRYLRTHNPSPFGGYLNYGEYQIVCASPERFLRMRDGHVETRPIKGTRKRGSTPEEDAALKKELEESGKDQSELLMIVDLERNDLNRVCIPGSVKVTELFSVETYATVFHLVSNVEGELQPDLTVMDLIESAFPGGSITGAPKYRAMEIIDELEHSRRNLYTGSIGYLTLDGNCDFNIVIRTALHRDGSYYLGVGGGITAESELEFEYEETLQKAKAVVEALGGEI